MERQELINCLSYALRYWEYDSKYKIYYDGEHVINSKYTLHHKEFLPIREFGYHHMSKVFENLITEEDKKLLDRYFNE